MTKNLPQRSQAYYTQTAANYDSYQLHQDDEHYNALMFLRGAIAEKQYKSLLDVGCGTGRALQYLKAACPTLHTIGVEPVEALRQIALEKGIGAHQMVAGDGYHLPFADHSFDCVSAFGVLHHVEHPEQVIAEMCRVASRAVFISDHNSYGWGSVWTRSAKQWMRKCLGFQLSKLILTGGQGYYDTDYDGIFYPFSLFDHLPQLQQCSNQMLIASTKGSPIHLYSEASHLAVLVKLD
jgi:ubiquinone/menaquinone biosynthesis C-methylase UbiE